ncbi:MAG: phage minor head protein [Bacteroidales bacterium]
MYESSQTELSSKSVGEFSFDEKIFNKAIKKIYEDKGYSEKALSSNEGLNMIQETYEILSSNVTLDKRTPIAARELINHNLWRFSGFKTDVQLREVAGKLYNESGALRSFSDFSKDVRQIHHNYNISYLRAEYDHVARSIEMFDKWNSIEEGDILQYRTMGDSKVRDEHKELEEVTLPKGDPFWDMYYPPNGWNCRCTAKVVRKGKYALSDSKKAIAIGNEATKLPKQQIFRTNPGNTLKLMPDKHPYFPKGCGDCDESKVDLRYDPKDPKCRSCRIINSLWRSPENVKKIRKETLTKAKETLKGRSFKHKDIPSEIVITKKGIEEMINQPHKFYYAKMKAMPELIDIIKNGEISRTDPDAKSNPMIKQYHYIEIEIAQGLKSYAVVRELISGECLLYSIVQKIKAKK